MLIKSMEKQNFFIKNFDIKLWETESYFRIYWPDNLRNLPRKRKISEDFDKTLFTVRIYW